MPITPEDSIAVLINILYSERSKRGLGRRTLAAKLAALTGRSVKTCTGQLNDWETGRKVPTLLNLIVWMSALGLRLNMARIPEKKENDHATA